MGKIKTCGACGNRDISISYYRVPKEKNRRKQWLKNSGADLSVSISDDTRICALHFTEDAFTKSSDAVVRIRRLKKSAVPSIIIDGSELESSRNRPKSKQTHECCFICGWWRNTENLSFFRFPRDINMQTEWLKILGLENVSSSVLNTKCLCSIHFNKADIINPKSRRPTLRKGCVPKSKTATVLMSEEIVYQMDTNDASSDLVEKSESDTSDMKNEAIDDDSVCIVTPTKNGQSVADGKFTFQASEPISNSLNTIGTPTATRINCENQKHRFQKPRYIGDISSPHLLDPQSAQNCINMTKDVIKKQRIVIHSLRRKLRIAEAKVKTMKDVIQYLKSQVHISEKDADYLMVSVSSVIN